MVGKYSKFSSNLSRKFNNNNFKLRLHGTTKAFEKYSRISEVSQCYLRMFLKYFIKKWQGYFERISTEF